MEDFVTIEIAKKLKEKGFRELCTHCYRNGNFRPQEMFCGLKSNTHHKWSFNSMEVKLKDTHERVQFNIVDAPTISQVLKWLREEKEVYVSVIPEYNEFNPVKGVTYRLEVAYWKDNEFGYETVEWLDKETYTIITFDSYEKALLEGIEYVIDNNLI